jgi:hypothetical protein
MKRYIKADDRKRHVYLSGKTQFGKTTTMLAMALQDITNGDGVCFIDAKGKDIPKLVNSIPDWRKKDCIYLDLKNPIPMDFMACENDDEVADLISDILEIFNRMEDGLGIRMDAIIRFTVLSLHLIGGTFLDIYNVITDESYRSLIRTHPKIKSNPVLSKFWGQQAEKLMKGESGVGIAISRMGRFVTSEAFQIILGTPRHAVTTMLDIAKAIEDKKVILVRLKPRSDEGMFYGSLIVSKIQQAIFRREDSKRKHPPFMLYVDEFQQFKSSGFDDILSMGGGLGLCLTLANQYLTQLDTNIEAAIIGCVSTFFLFNQDPSNAGKLAGILREPQALSHIEKIRELKKTLRDLNESKRFWDNIDEGYNQQAEVRQSIENCEYDIDYLERRQKEKPLTFLQQLPDLPIGKAVYRAADGTTVIINTPKPLQPAKDIKQEIIDGTVARYGKKRTVDKSPSNSPQNPHTKGNGIDYDTIEPLDPS